MSICLALSPFLATLTHPSISLAARSAPIIIDHTSIALFDQIPQYWFDQVKSELKVAYQHTSHGSQKITGTNLLNQRPDLSSTVPECTGYTTLNTPTEFCSDFAYYEDIRWNRSPQNSKAPAHVLSFHNSIPTSPNAADLGNPNYTNWYFTTLNHLSSATRPEVDRNVIIWAWCGQVSNATTEIISRDYLANMALLEQTYPHVHFVYMTGHLDGTFSQGNLHQRNEQIRTFTRMNNKILYDFADIERFSPDGNDFLDRGAGIYSDGCRYNSGNWCTAWCSTNPCPSCVTCAHSHCFNCYQKGKAMWVMLAQIAGWNPNSTNPTPSPTPHYSLDSDTDIDILDILILISRFTQNLAGDFNGNGRIDIFDFNMLLRQ